jgi:transposase
MGAVTENPLQKWRTSSWLLLHDDATAHRSVLVKEFLAKSNVMRLEHPRYTPDLAAAHVCLLPRLKSSLRGDAFVMLLEI